MLKVSNDIKIVMVVEDEPDLNDLLTELFTGEDYKVLSAHSAVEALKMLETEACDVITLDYGLPDLDGNGFQNLVPQQAKDIPIIAVSATPELFKPAPQIKATIEKPFNLDELLLAIAKVLAER